MSARLVAAGGGRRLWAAALVALTATLSACAGLPDSGSVIQGGEVGISALEPFRLQLAGPTPGIERVELVRGFLTAALVTQDDAQAARQYLTPEASKVWTPGQSGAVVYSSRVRPTITIVDSSRVKLTLPAAATIDRDGRYRELPDGTVISTVVTLAQVAGEWRIAKVPDDLGPWIPSDYLDRLYRPVGIAYASASAPQMIMDYRWFPVTQGIATTLARAQAGPPPSYLAGAVTSGFSGGSPLGVEAVPVVGGVASVTFSESLATAAPETLRLAWAQMLATLTQVRSVNRISVEVTGKEIDAPGTGAAPTSVTDLGYAPASTPPAPQVLLRMGDDILVLDSAQLGRDTGDKQVPTGRVLRKIPAAWTALAASSDLSVLAATSGDRADVHIWRDSGDGITPARFGRTLTRPSFDRYGGIWVAGTDLAGKSQIWVIDPGSSTPRVVGTSWLNGSRIIDLRIAADGQRAAVLTTNRRGALTIGLAGITREVGAAGRARAVLPPQGLGGGVRDALSAAWLDEETLAVVGRRSTAESRHPILVSTSGPSSSLPILEDVRALASTGGVSGLLARTGDKGLAVPSARRWQSIRQAEDVVVPGS